MDSQLRSNGSNTRSITQAVSSRLPGRSRIGGRVERVVNTAIAGERAAVLNATTAELLAESEAVAGVFAAALDRAGTGVMAHWNLQELLRRSRLDEDLLNGLASPNPQTRAAAARLCGAARMSESLIWIADLLADASPKVRDSAVRALARLGGRRAVEVLMANAGRIAPYRLAIALSRAASDVDIEALIRAPESERAALVTVLACGLRRDVLRVSALLGIAHDRRWPKEVRKAACKSLAAIGDRSATDGLKRLSDAEPDPDVKKAAQRAHRRLLKRVVAR